MQGKLDYADKKCLILLETKDRRCVPTLKLHEKLYEGIKAPEFRGYYCRNFVVPSGTMDFIPQYIREKTVRDH